MNTQRKLIAALSLSVTVAVPNLVSAVAISGQGTWETTLQGRDLDGDLSTAEAYYDTALDITWLADANYAMISGYNAVGTSTSDGRMTWQNANAWAASLNPYGSGIIGWRQPTTVDVGNAGVTYTNIFQGVDYGYNITTHSEMSHMFYVTLGNTAWFNTSGTETGCSAPAYCLTNTGSFSNLQSAHYWSATEYAPDTTIYAWEFDFKMGAQTYVYKTTSAGEYVWAVHDGDVGVATPSTVPVPAAAWLLGSGLVSLIGVIARRRR